MSMRKFVRVVQMATIGTTWRELCGSYVADIGHGNPL